LRAKAKQSSFDWFFSGLLRLRSQRRRKKGLAKTKKEAHKDEERGSQRRRKKNFVGEKRNFATCKKREEKSLKKTQF